MTDTAFRFTIKELSDASGVSRPTIRYYEEIGLTPPAMRDGAGHRHYRRADLDRMIFIRRCRDLGFGIAQVRLLAGLSADGEDNCTGVRAIAAEHLESVREKLAECRRLEAQLAEFVAACDSACSDGPARDCVVLAELSAG